MLAIFDDLVYSSVNECPVHCTSGHDLQPGLSRMGVQPSVSSCREAIGVQKAALSDQFLSRCFHVTYAAEGYVLTESHVSCSQSDRLRCRQGP